MSVVMTKLTPNAIKQLDDPPDCFCPTVQVLQVQKVCGDTPDKLRYRLILSDGNFFVHSTFGKKQLSHFIDDRVVCANSVIKILQYVTHVATKNVVVVVILDLVVLHNPGHQIGSPVLYDGDIPETPCCVAVKKRKPDDSVHNTRNSQVKSHFRLLWEENQCAKSSSGVLCENCANSPCDWTEHGPCILSYFIKLSEEVTLSNKEKRFLAYTAYTMLKYGYLGQNNRRRIPLCVKNGIRLNYSEDSGVYIGFKETAEE
jgi:hypothetical protein